MRTVRVYKKNFDKNKTFVSMEFVEELQVPGNEKAPPGYIYFPKEKKLFL